MENCLSLKSFSNHLDMLGVGVINTTLQICEVSNFILFYFIYLFIYLFIYFFFFVFFFLYFLFLFFSFLFFFFFFILLN